MKNPNYFLRIAKRDGKIIGFIDGRFDGKKYELGGLYVDKKEHGKGVAQALWQSFLEWVKPGLDMTLSVATYNDRAKAFYAKLGFKELPGTERKHNDGIIPIVDMIRKGEKS